MTQPTGCIVDILGVQRIWGVKEIARLHWGALKRMILDRGGFPAFRQNHLLHTKLVWYVCSSLYLLQIRG